MSIQALYTAATGMTALETKLDVVSNNLANVNTTSFKKGRANFEDLYYRQKVLPGILNTASGTMTPTGIGIGLGSRVSSVQTNFEQGAFQQTGGELDVAIEGKGFFQVINPAGDFFYTRAGNFSINAIGQLVLGSASDGRVLQPPMTVPQDTTNITIAPDGTVQVKQAGSNQLTTLGQIQLAQVINPEGMLKMGENLYVATEAAGPVNVGNAGQNGLGMLRQNALEASNVEPVQELIDLITTQRAFELNSQAVQAGDQLLQLVSNLRRF